MRTICAIRLSRFSLAGGFLCLSIGITTAKADQSRFVNVKLETRTLVQSLETSVEQMAAEGQQPLWVAYGVEAVAGDHSLCCGNDRGNDHGTDCGTCNLEEGHDNSRGWRNESETLKLEGQPQLIVLLRVERKTVMRIRLASENCTLDAGGLRVVWLSNVKPQESVALLAKYVRAREFEGDGDRSLSGQALTAIAWHADASADRAFTSFIDPGQPSALRDKASFWLGAARGPSGLVLLQRMAQTDPSGAVRSQVSFALYVSREPGALEEMIRMAHDDLDAHVRGQALFWLAQKAGKKAGMAITGAIQDDPDTEVKKKAVFALSQMPKDEGVPKLIEVAQTNKNPEVRKQAMFWLGQSEDPRALEFFEKVLAP